MARQEDAPDRAERLIRELREASAEAAGVLKDLQGTIRGARAQLEEYHHSVVEAVLTEYTTHLREAITRWTTEAVADVRRVMNQACEQAADHIRKDAELSETVHMATQQAIIHLRDLGYDFAQPSNHR